MALIFNQRSFVKKYRSLALKQILPKMNKQNANPNGIGKRKFIDAEPNAEEGKRQKQFVQRPGLPVELLNELFSALPLEDALHLLDKMPNFILARNVRNMLKSINKAMKANKWNAADCGPKISILQQGIVLKHSEPIGRWNCVRAVLPIPKLKAMNASIKFYFEVKILHRSSNWTGISLGFCTLKFPLEGKLPGKVENSFGISYTGQMDIDKSRRFFGDSREYFQTGDIIGIGIVHFATNSPMNCFAACNGKLLMQTKLPAKFVELELFPAVTLFGNGDSIKANFGSSEWRFNPRQMLLE